MDDVQLFGPADSAGRMPTVALTVASRSPADVARSLAEKGVVASAGLQCAPLAHLTLGTAPEGVLRFSVGVETCADDIEFTLDVFQRVCSAHG